MKTVYKFELSLASQGQDVWIPRDATVLRIAIQHGRLMLWALVRPDNSRCVRSFIVYATGQPIGDDDVAHNQYVGTAITKDGDHVWHVFERVVK
jgi:hypothetical protein